LTNYGDKLQEGKHHVSHRRERVTLKRKSTEGAAPVVGGAIEIEANRERAIGAGIAVCDASIAREATADGTNENVLILPEKLFGENQSAVTGDVDGLS
jgi:hypothetical protein